MTALCHLMNVEEIIGSSAWFRLHFKGEKIPFGALVEFKPSNARGDKREKFEPKGETCIFAGYNLSSGLHLARKYRAWALTSFAGAFFAGLLVPPVFVHCHCRQERYLSK